MFSVVLKSVEVPLGLNASLADLEKGQKWGLGLRVNHVIFIPPQGSSTPLSSMLVVLLPI